MNEDNVLNIYDQNYAQNYNQRFLLNDLSKIDADFERETIARLLEEIGDNPQWLDVACGTGYFLSCFPEVERAGLDISPAMLETARQANTDILLIQGDYRDKRPEWEDKWDLCTQVKLN
jgi:ubiquinone/menaquinone biosynthesis C-methylase UbiE